MNTSEEGKRLVRQAGWVLENEVRDAFTQENYSLTVRRSQEVVELALRGGVRILGGDYPRIHDVAPVFCRLVEEKLNVTDRNLEKVLEISGSLSESRAPSFYMERDYSKEDARKALDGAQFVLKEVTIILELE